MGQELASGGVSREEFEAALVRLNRARSLSSNYGNLGGLIAVAIVGGAFALFHRMGYTASTTVLIVAMGTALLAGKWLWRRRVDRSYRRAEDKLRQAAAKRGISI